MKSAVSRYHPLLVVLHWLLAVLILAMLGIGWFVLAQTPNSDPGKIGVLKLHMATGSLILLLTAIRLLVRLVTTKPPRAGPWLVSAAHWGVYALVLAMIATGFATVILSGLNTIVFGTPGQALPASLDGYPTRTAHLALAVVLTLAIGGHLAAALYHQFIARDGLLHRMAFGRRTA